MTLPMTISEDPLRTANIEVLNSGSDVPNETNVTPMINGLIPRKSPIRSALSINLLEPMIRLLRLTTKVKKSTITSEYYGIGQNREGAKIL